MFLVYISSNGRRDNNCGTIENSCSRIDYVLFNRTRPTTVYIEAFADVNISYTVKLPLNILSSVTLKKYGGNNNPVIKTKADRLFIIRNSGNFSLQDVNVDLPENGILLDIDSTDHYLESISLINVFSIKEKIIAINMKMYQGIDNIVASNVTFDKGTLLMIHTRQHLFRTSLPGDWRQNKAKFEQPIDFR